MGAGALSRLRTTPSDDSDIYGDILALEKNGAHVVAGSIADDRVEPLILQPFFIAHKSYAYCCELAATIDALDHQYFHDGLSNL